MSEGGGRQRLYLHRGGLQGSVRCWPKEPLEVEKYEAKRKRGFTVPKHHAPPKWPKAVMFIYFFPFKN